jgi:hypothetical protein
MARRDPIAGRPRAFAALTGPGTDRPGSYFLVYRWRSVRASGVEFCIVPDAETIATYRSR